MHVKTGKFSAGMILYALAFSLGIVCLHQLPVLPDSSVLVLLLFCVALLILIFSVVKKQQNLVIISRYITLTILFILGFVYASFTAERQLAYRLDESVTGKNILLSGQVSSIPGINGDVQRFEFDVEKFRVLQKDADTDKAVSKKFTQQLTKHFPKKVRLSWYYGETVNAGEKWQLLVRLKPPHGFMNPGGFDYESWLFQHGIHATGYVRKSSLNSKQLKASGWSINNIRQQLSQQIDSINGSAGENTTIDKIRAVALVKALAVGDKSSISARQWQVLTSTGTSHLMAISGLHIGLASLFAYVLVRRIVPVCVLKRIPAQHVALLSGMFLALLYALIAGLSIPTQRAIIMLFTLSIMMLLRRNSRPVDTLGLALLLVLLFDPLAVLSAGFWFSFSAVAVIYISLTAQKDSSQGLPHNQPGEEDTFYRKSGRILKHWVSLQLVISIFLLPMSLFMFQQVSLVAPLANLLLIPYVSFLVVPVVLVAIVCSFVFPEIALLLFDLATTLLDVIWPILSYLAELPFALWVQGNVGISELLLATISILLIFYASKITQNIVIPVLNKTFQNHEKTIVCLVRTIASLLFMPVFFSDFSTLKAGEYQVVILDVGQGSAAVIQTKNHVAVVDTGARFSDKFDAGSAVVTPYLRSQGLTQINRLIISHGDADHIGGAQALLDTFPGTTLIGQDLENLVMKGEGNREKQACVEGMKWHWDEIDFEFLFPNSGPHSAPPSDHPLIKPVKRNNHSCVLRVSSKFGSVLLTGDIEKKVERKIIEKFANQLLSDVLVVPHHGSNTSSSSAFINTVDPKISVISAGYKNRYKLPSSKVMQRYKASNRELVQTANSGAITISFKTDKALNIERFREKAKKYWHHQIF